MPCLSTLHRDMTTGKDNQIERRKNKRRSSNLILEQVHLHLVFAKVEKIQKRAEWETPPTPFSGCGRGCDCRWTLLGCILPQGPCFFSFFFSSSFSSLHSSSPLPPPPSSIIHCPLPTPLCHKGLVYSSPPSLKHPSASLLITIISSSSSPSRHLFSYALIPKTR